MKKPGMALELREGAGGLVGRCLAGHGPQRIGATIMKLSQPQA